MANASRVRVFLAGRGKMGAMTSDDSMARSAFRRGARLASLPLGYAGRRTVGLGKRIGGSSAESVSAQMQQRTAEQLFRVLGELKGGAMKFGQALSLFESVLPDEVAEPYREHLAKLQDSAPPMPTSRVHAVLARELGADWRSNFQSFDPLPAAAASIGQVHHGVWSDGREVAVKVQYPGADEALRSDLRQIGRLAGMAGPISGGIDIRALVAELTERVSEELDYRLEAESQERFAVGLEDSEEFAVPHVLANTSRVMVSEWINGPALSVGTRTDGDRMPEAERTRAAISYVRFLFAGPSLVGLLHADPHPGNFKVLSDGRLGAVDFGLVAQFPDGLPAAMGHIMRIAMSGDADAMTAGLRQEGFVVSDIDSQDLMDYLAPFVEPAAVESFHFNRGWMREQFKRVSNTKTAGGVGMKLNLPASYLLIHRVWLGGIAVLAQLDVRANFRAVLEEFLPGFTDDENAP